MRSPASSWKRRACQTSQARNGQRPHPSAPPVPLKARHACHALRPNTDSGRTPKAPPAASR
eukprot:9489813-Pyramimonas_sp.AAC.1